MKDCIPTQKSVEYRRKSTHNTESNSKTNSTFTKLGHTCTTSYLTSKGLALHPAITGERKTIPRRYLKKRCILRDNLYLEKHRINFWRRGLFFRDNLYLEKHGTNFWRRGAFLEIICTWKSTESIFISVIFFSVWHRFALLLCHEKRSWLWPQRLFCRRQSGWSAPQTCWWFQQLCQLSCPAPCPVPGPSSGSLSSAAPPPSEQRTSQRCWGNSHQPIWQKHNNAPMSEQRTGQCCWRNSHQPIQQKHNISTVWPKNQSMLLRKQSSTNMTKAR